MISTLLCVILVAVSFAVLEKKPGLNRVRAHLPRPRKRSCWLVTQPYPPNESLLKGAETT